MGTTKKVKIKAPKGLRGFARIKFEDPDRLKDISKRAGKRSAMSEKHRGWTRSEAASHARAGGFARHGVKKIKIGG